MKNTIVIKKKKRKGNKAKRKRYSQIVSNTTQQWKEIFTMIQSKLINWFEVNS